MGRRATPEYNLQTEFPEVAAEWHPTKNGDLKPTDVTPYSGKRVWWRCDKGHEWKTSVSNRSWKGSGCAACIGRVASNSFNLKVAEPYLAEEWHPDNRIKATQITPGSGRRVKWKCRICQHAWRAAPKDRVRGNGCPACSGRVATPTNNLAVSDPELAKLWHPDNKKSPYEVTRKSNQKAKWKCPVCTYEWIAAPYYTYCCSSCSGRVATEFNNICETHPEIMKDWAPENEVDPKEITYGSTALVKWKCHKCGHAWETSPNSRTNASGSKSGSCPACAGKVATPDNNFARSHPELVKDWHPDNDFSPADITPKSSKKVKWRCHKCGYEWTGTAGARICHDTKYGKYHRCISCCGRIATDTRNFSLDFPELVKDWHPDNQKKPSDYVSGSCKKVMWRCHTCGHEWWATVRARGKLGTRCACCAGREKQPSKFFVTKFFDIWTKKLWPYETAGKVEACEMFQEELQDLGYFDLRFLSLPGNGREIHALIENGFDFDYPDCLGVERKKAKRLRAFFKRLFQRGEVGGVIPVVKADIDDLLLGQRDIELPEFNAVHLDYNGTLTSSHVLATEAALRDNPEALVAVTVKQVDRFGWRDVDYEFGDFPFATLDPELLFYQPYQGIKGQWMEMYCFRNWERA